MNNVRATRAINEKELQLGIKASWHDEYKDSAYVYIGGLDPELTEGDVITIFSQYGEPVDINLPKEKAPPSANSSSEPTPPPPPKQTKSRGFCFLMYENQLSTNLAVDNLNGAVVLGRTLRVDHCKNYKQLERNQDGKMIERDGDLGERLNARPELHYQPHGKGHSQSASDREVDLEDPMAHYLLEKKRKRQERKRLRQDAHPDAEKDQSRQHHRKDMETKEERKARKDAKRVKKLWKEVGPPRHSRAKDE